MKEKLSQCRKAQLREANNLFIFAHDLIQTIAKKTRKFFSIQKVVCTKKSENEKKTSVKCAVTITWQVNFLSVLKPNWYLNGGKEISGAKSENTQVFKNLLK